MEKVFTREAVEVALQLVALGVAGMLDPKYAKEKLEALPEDLSKMVMATTMSAHATQKAVLPELLDKLIEKAVAKDLENELKDSKKP